MIFQITKEDLDRHYYLSYIDIGKWSLEVCGCLIGLYSSREEVESIFYNLGSKD